MALIQAGWRPFRDAVGALPAARMDEPTSAGWTLKEMVAHVAYWEETVPARVAGLRSPGDAGDGRGVDEINA
ncbi:MAG: maleylpyruvate isomerase N-terminal domain-containing protein, partial [Candidatus Limnocylindria bacterium]